MRLTIRSLSPLAAVAALGLASTAHGGDIYNNLGPGNSFSNGGQILQGPAVGTIGDVDQATRFTTTPFFHEAISVFAGIFVDTQPDGSGDLLVSINADNGAGGPGAILASELMSLSPGKQLISSTFASLILNPSTNYWLVLDSRTTLDGGWNRNDQGITGVSAGRSNLNPWTVDLTDDDVFAFRVVSRVETVPEPATMAALGLGALAMLRRRRKV